MSKVRTILTSKDTGDRLTEKEFLPLVDYNGEGDFTVHTKEQYQTILGFGGAFTEAAAYTLSQISPEKRDEVIKNYFHPEEGLGYTIGRVAIHSCDFALGNYTYVEEGDEKLTTFSIEREHKWVLPLVKDAMKEKGGEIDLLASPWSPPAWMKSNGEMNNGGKLLPQYRDAWAKYYAKFVHAFREAGVDIWGLSVQNEPAAVQVWDSCIYSAEEERDFIKDHLGPTLVSEGLEDLKLVIWDHNRDIMVERSSTILEDPEAAKYVWGTGFHWYVSEAFENVGEVHNRFPDKHLLFTEGCQEGGVKLGEWFTGERYGRNIIGDLNNWTEGYIDWNMVLNEEGGPNHVGNLCDAPVIADTKTGEVHYNSSFYYIGHFSKYIRPQAVRVGLDISHESLQSTAFLNEDGSLVMVVMNESDYKEEFTVSRDQKAFHGELPPHSIATYILEQDAQ